MFLKARFVYSKIVAGTGNESKVVTSVYLTALSSANSSVNSAQNELSTQMQICQLVHQNQHDVDEQI